jgi:protein-S-isoprenylcysteine O-methyltransferase Ste14
MTAGRASLVARAALFTLFVPGTVLAWAPAFLVAGRATVAAHWPPAPADLGGMALAVCGAAVYLACAWRFVVEGFGTPAPWDAPRRLVTGGLYRWTRNPMYVGITVALLGEAWWWRSTAVLVYAAAVTVAFHLRVVMHEEPALRRLFGADFTAYCARVRRWGVV